MGQAQINVRTRACSRTSIARTKQAALTHNVRGKELMCLYLSVANTYDDNNNNNRYFRGQPFSCDTGGADDRQHPGVIQRSIVGGSVDGREDT